MTKCPFIFRYIGFYWIYSNFWNIQIYLISFIYCPILLYFFSITKNSLPNPKLRQTWALALAEAEASVCRCRSFGTSLTKTLFLAWMCQFFFDFGYIWYIMLSLFNSCTKNILSKLITEPVQDRILLTAMIRKKSNTRSMRNSTTKFNKFRFCQTKSEYEHVLRGSENTASLHLLFYTNWPLFALLRKFLL